MTFFIKFKINKKKAYFHYNFFLKKPYQQCGVKKLFQELFPSKPSVSVPAASENQEHFSIEGICLNQLVKELSNIKQDEWGSTMIKPISDSSMIKPIF